MMDRPLVSVILPVFNEEKYIASTIDSILNQTLKNFELIIINDGSIDRTQEIINNFVDRRIILIENEKNLGIATSLNLGLRIAKTDMICRIDGNDSAMPDRLEKQYRFLKENSDCGLVTTPVVHIFEDGSQKVSGHYRSSNTIPGYLLFNNCIFHTAVMLRASAIPEGGFDNRFACEDYHMWSKIIFNWKIVILKEPLTKVRDLSGGLRYLPSNKKDSIEVRKTLFKTIGLKFNDQYLNDPGSNFFSNEMTWYKKIKLIFYFETLRNQLNCCEYSDLFNIDQLISSRMRSLFKSKKNIIPLIFFLITPLKLKNLPLIRGRIIFKLVIKQLTKCKRYTLDGDDYKKKWEYLNSISELGRYSIINGYIKYFKFKKILDAGCGEGILFSNINSTSYDEYTGVDVSKTAIENFSKIKNKKTRLIVSDLSRYRTKEKFDLIIFSESLSYFENTKKIIEKYEKFLLKKGMIVISVFEEQKTKDIWKKIPNSLSIIDSVLIKNNGLTWRIKLFDKV